MPPRLTVPILIASFVAIVACGTKSRFADTSAKTDRRVAPTRADSLTVRLSPRAFPTLPSAVRADMERRGCSVPQTPQFTEPHNVVSGAFIQAGQTDWAVLCSVDLVSRILVYRGGRTDVVDSLARSDDRGFLQGNGRDAVVFSRVIQAVDSSNIITHAEAYNGLKPSPIDHMGIDDGFMDKGSSVLYFFKGKWLKLLGGD